MISVVALRLRKGWVIDTGLFDLDEKTNNDVINALSRRQDPVGNYINRCVKMSAIIDFIRKKGDAAELLKDFLWINKYKGYRNQVVLFQQNWFGQKYEVLFRK